MHPGCVVFTGWPLAPHRVPRCLRTPPPLGHLADLRTALTAGSLKAPQCWAIPNPLTQSLEMGDRRIVSPWLF